MVSHNFPPDTVANLELNTLLDGFFHATTWVVTLAGAMLTWRAMGETRSRPAGRVLAGGLLAGWGLLNVVEGIIDHQILGIHHVRPGPDELLSDVAFLIWGAVMIVVGAYLLRAPYTRGRAATDDAAVAARRADRA